MCKKCCCVFVAVLLLVSLLLPASAFATSYNTHCPNCGTVQFQGVLTEHMYCPECGCLLFQAGGGSYRGGGAGRLETGKKYYTAPSDGGADNLYNSGYTSYYSIVNQQNNTLNYTSYSSSTNNYVMNSYTYNTYNYNQTYNYYTYTVNNQNYYITNYYTYVIVSYPAATSTPDVPAYENSIYYYELPDGRNSYNLTVEDVWGQYFIYDAVNYKEVVEDDGTTMALYHLDGNYSDSSANGAPDIESHSYLTLSDGFFDGGLYFNDIASTAELEIPFVGAMPKYTIEFRIKYLSARIDPKRSALDNGEVLGTFLYNGIFHNCYDTSNTGKFDLPLNTWTSVAITYDSVSNKCVVFVNGSKQSIDSSFNFANIYTSSGYSISNDTGVRAYNNKGTGPWMYCGWTTFAIDEIRISNKILYTSDYTPSSQPFDTNSVLVLPEEGVENQIAVKSNISVSDIRVGGVRPTYPINGYTYVYLEDNVVKDVQQYQNNGWQSVDAAIYLDGEWKSLKDTDLSDYGNDEESPSTPSPSSDPGDPTPSPSDNPETTLPPSTPETGDGDGDSDLNGLIDMILSLLNGLGDLFAAVISGLFSLFESLLTMASGFSEFLKASFGYLPADVLNVLGAGVVLMIVLAVIKFIRG